MKDLLIEILVEEIPADFAYPASLSFKKIIEETLKMQCEPEVPTE